MAMLVLAGLCAGPAIASENDWELKRDRDDIRVYTRDVAGSKFKAVKATTTVTAPLSAAVALIRDTSACPQVAALCKKSWVHKTVSETELYVYSYNDLPWPVKDRDVLVRALWSQDPTNFRVTMTATSVTGMMAENDQAIRLREASFNWELVPLEAGRLQVTTHFHIDPAGPMPALVMNLLLVDAPFKTLTNLRSVLETGKYDDVRFEFVTWP
jgi:hypothetical protein